MAWPEGMLHRYLTQPAPTGWTGEQWRSVCEAVAAGRSYGEAARHARLSVNQVIGVAHRRAFPKRPSPLGQKPAQAAAAAEQRAAWAAERAAATAQARADAQARREAEQAAKAAEKERQAAEAAAAKVARGAAAPPATGRQAANVVPFLAPGRSPAPSDAARLRKTMLGRLSGQAAPAAIRPPIVRRPAVRFDRCQWPHGEPGQPHFRFCAASPVVLGRPYCAEHCAVAYTRTADEIARAEAVRRQVVGTPDNRPFGGKLAR